MGHSFTNLCIFGSIRWKELTNLTAITIIYSTSMIINNNWLIWLTWSNDCDVHIVFIVLPSRSCEKVIRCTFLWQSQGMLTHDSNTFFLGFWCQPLQIIASFSTISPIVIKAWHDSIVSYIIIQCTSKNNKRKFSSTSQSPKTSWPIWNPSGCSSSSARSSQLPSYCSFTPTSMYILE